jgi:3-methyladenine DNA glycosylase AlkD
MADTLKSVLLRLHQLADPEVARKAEHFGIKGVRVLGVSAPQLRRLAKSIGTNQALSLRLWHAGFLEARALAALVGDPSLVTRRQMEQWAKDFDNWAVCDVCCGELFVWTSFAREKSLRWIERKEEYVKRAGFVMMAAMAIKLKSLPDGEFLSLLKVLPAAAADERNFVKKAVSWALRQIGKRTARLNRSAISTATRIQQLDSRAARWVASDSLRELQSTSVRRRLRWRRRTPTRRVLHSPARSHRRKP